MRQFRAGVALYFVDLLFVDLIYEAANVDRVLERAGLSGGGAGRPIEASFAIEVLARARESR